MQYCPAAQPVSLKQRQLRVSASHTPSGWHESGSSRHPGWQRASAQYSSAGQPRSDWHVQRRFEGSHSPSGQAPGSSRQPDRHTPFEQYSSSAQPKSFTQPQVWFARWQI